MATKVIDVSRWNGNIDFAKVKASGITGVIIKAGVTGYGAGHSMERDANFETNYKNAKAAGLNVGAYYYSGAMSEDFAVKEANYFLTLLKGKQFDLPVYMDVEETHSPTNMPSLGKTKLTAIVYEWCETVEKVFRRGFCRWDQRTG
jgi:GH25 family lysozyme M1 (1,4-beta-N-acetylmuramidase)